MKIVSKQLKGLLNTIEGIISEIGDGLAIIAVVANR